MKSIYSSMLTLLSVAIGITCGAAESRQPGKVAAKPLFRDPVFDGAADPVLCWNRAEKKWFMFYTNRRANVTNAPGVSWVHGTPIGIAESSDSGASWKYRGTADITYGGKGYTYWAPEVIDDGGSYHMFLSVVPGIFTNWNTPRDIVHLTSRDLLKWTYESTLKLSSDRVIDACVMPLPDKTWRLWYNNERDRKSIYYADSRDLFTWADRGKAVGDQPGEGPDVFRWKNRYWMIVDVWDGLGVYSSDDCLKWVRQAKNLLQEPGHGPDDQAKGGHPDAVVSGDRAFLFYFTHPGRYQGAPRGDGYEQRRSSIQVVELELKDGEIICDRDRPTPILLQPMDDRHSQAAETAERPPFLDPAQPVEKRVQDLISRLTLEEKAMLLNHKGTTVERFKIRADQWNQCLNGVKWDRPTTFFPTCIGLAATWNTGLVHEVATVLSDEARAIYNGWKRDPAFPGEHKGLIYRAPVINIGRNPYWGRNHEAWGEDPYLTGRMAVTYVRGLQGDDPRYLKLASTLKHYAVNNVETDRQKLNAVVSERMLREYWLPHFREAVVEGKAQSLMASYNAINGTPNNINHWLLTDVLKNEWGHEGFVVSDLGGVRTMVQGHAAGKMTYVDAVAQSLMAGCDFSDKEFEANIPAAVREGKLTETRLNDALFRVLRTRMRLGEFDPPDLVPYSKISPDIIGCPAHRAISLKAARQSIVLLQNRHSFLPLDKTTLKRIAVLGPLADAIIMNNYSGKAGQTISPLQGIKDRLAPGTEIQCARGCDVAKGGNEGASIDEAAAMARDADVALVFVGTTGAVEHEGRDRKSLGLSGNQEALVKAVFAANPRTVVVQMSAGPLTVPWLKQNLPAMLQAWWPGEEGGHAIADVLLGDVNPAGRLPHTVYASADQVPPLDEYDISKGFTYLYLNGRPLFPFGHGLSYTEFKYANLKVTPKTIPATGTVTVSVEVKNIGKRAGDEVVQLYVHDVASSVKRPVKELRGFDRISLKPGEKQTVTFKLPGEKLAFWDEKTHGFVVEPGAFDVLVGSSSEAIRLQSRMNVN